MLDTGDADTETFHQRAPCRFLLFILVVDYRLNLIYTLKNVGGIKLARNYIWGYDNNKVEYR